MAFSNVGVSSLCISWKPNINMVITHDVCMVLCVTYVTAGGFIMAWVNPSKFT